MDYERDYEVVEAGRTNEPLGTVGSSWDFLEGLLVIVEDPSDSMVSIRDGGGPAILVFPDNPGSGIGTYPVPLGLVSRAGAWQVTTGGGVQVIAMGVFRS